MGRLRGLLETLSPNQRGSTYTRFVRIHLDVIDTLVGTLIADFPIASFDAERLVIGRKLYRFKMLLDGIHGNVVDYRYDIGRRDLPVGLLHLIDALINDLLKASADPIVHLDRAYMYSTIRLADQWEPLSNELGVLWTDPVEPIILNLPGLDPTNALLSPILVHEVGHAVIRRNDLVREVDSRLDVSTVDELKAVYVATPSADLPAAMEQFGRWVEELLCDALASELTGPGLLFGGAVFLPASSAGHSGQDHPDPGQRVGLTLEQLARSGWLEALEVRCPSTIAWLKSIAAVPASYPSPRETFLRELVVLAQDAIIDVAKDYVVDSGLAWVDYSNREAEIDALLGHGVPPAEIDGDPVSPWNIVAAVWMHGIGIHGDGADGLAKTVADSALSSFALKTIEMSRVLGLWKAGYAASA